MKLSQYNTDRTYKTDVVSSERITDESTAEVRHIILRVADPSFQYLEGQSIAVIVPGPHSFGNEDHIRLYSIASSREGEGQREAEFSICVRRCSYIDEISGERYPGVASNYLCDLKAGDSIQIAGPYGRQFHPPRDENSNILMIGVGTGIAPFRAFVKHIYESGRNWKGQVRLFYGARTGMDMLYMNDHNKDIANYYDETTFKAFEALSPRPHFDEPADIARTIQENSEEIWSLLNDPKITGNEPFAVLLGDTIINSVMPVTQQLIDVYEQYQATTVAVEVVPKDKVSRYGIVGGEKLSDQIMEVTNFIEKPAIEEAPSNLAIAGRYILTSEIYSALEQTPKGKNNEFQLTDALMNLTKKEQVVSHTIEGKRYDIGNKLDYLKTTVEYALRRKEFAKPFYEYLKKIVEQNHIE